MQTVKHVNVSAFDDNSHENEHSYTEKYRHILKGGGASLRKYEFPGPHNTEFRPLRTPLPHCSMCFVISGRKKHIPGTLILMRR